MRGLYDCLPCPRQARGAKRLKATWSIRRRLIPLVALCGTHVGVPFESIEYLSRGAAIHDPVERGAPVRQPDVEPSNKLQLVPSSDLLLGPLRLRGTKDCNDLSRLCRRRTGDPLQVHRVPCGYEAPNPNQQRDYRNRWALHGLLDLEPWTTCWTLWVFQNLRRAMTRNKHHISKPPECAASLPVVGGSGRRRQTRTGVRRLQEPAVDRNASYMRALLFCWLDR